MATSKIVYCDRVLTASLGNIPALQTFRQSVTTNIYNAQFVALRSSWHQ